MLIVGPLADQQTGGEALGFWVVEHEVGTQRDGMLPDKMVEVSDCRSALENLVVVFEDPVEYPTDPLLCELWFRGPFGCGDAHLVDDFLLSFGKDLAERLLGHSGVKERAVDL